MWSNFGKRVLCTPPKVFFLFILLMHRADIFWVCAHTQKMLFFISQWVDVDCKRPARNIWTTIIHQQRRWPVRPAFKPLPALCPASPLRGRAPANICFSPRLVFWEHLFSYLCSFCKYMNCGQSSFFNTKFLFHLQITQKNWTLPKCVLGQSGTDTIIGDWRCASIWGEVTKSQQNDNSGTAGCVYSGNV